MKFKIVIELSFISAMIIFFYLTHSFNSARSATFKKEASIFVGQLVNKVATQLTENSISQLERIDRFKFFFNSYFAVEGIGK